MKRLMPSLSIAALAVGVAPALSTAASSPDVTSARASLPTHGDNHQDRRDKDRTKMKPLVVGHRGASGHRPEHTLAAYELDARMGADFIEPDLVSTKDGHLVARHEPEISETTDVTDRPEFADRRTTKQLDGRAVTGFFTTDFTLKGLGTLRGKERLPLVRQENTMWDGRFEVPTFDEVLMLRARLSKELGREIGVYPETMHPTFFQDLGLDLEPKLATSIRTHGLDSKNAPIFIQSFELSNLYTLRNALNVKARLVFLTSSGAPYDLVAKGDPRTYAGLTTAASLQTLGKTINGLGPEKSQVIPRNADDPLSGRATTLVKDPTQPASRCTPTPSAPRTPSSRRTIGLAPTRLTTAGPSTSRSASSRPASTRHPPY